MNFEKIAWWIFWTTFTLALVIAILGFSLSIITASPAELSYILGLITFLLLGNRLIFGYGWLTNFLEGILSQNEVYSKDIEKIKDKIERDNLNFSSFLRDLSIKVLTSIFLKDLDYYKYSYYVGFVIVTLLAIMSKFNLLGEFILGRYIEGIFWGAATATLFVWGLEQLAKSTFMELISANLKEKNNMEVIKDEK